MPRKPVSNLSEEVVSDSQSRASGPVVRAFSILKCISEGSYTLSEIAQQCNMSLSTTHGLLQKLKKAKAVIYNPVNHRYYIGQLIPQLTSNLVFTHQFLIAGSLEEMKRLAAYTRVTITLVILIGFKVFRINTIHGSHPLKVTDAQDAPNVEETFLSAPGKVLYAQLSEENLKKLTRFIKPGSSKSPEATFNELMTDLKQVRRVGYAVSSGIRLQGVSCISVPISTYGLPAALNVIGPDARIKPNLKSFVERAIKTAANVDKSLSFEAK